MFTSKNISSNFFVLLSLFVVSSFSFIHGYDVSGVVYGEDSVTAIPLAEIYAYAQGTNDAVIPPVCVAQTIADNNGKYSVSVDGNASKYYILAEHPDISTEYGKRIKKWISGATTTADVLMQHSHDGFADITGTITNSNGDPVSNVKVVLRQKVSAGGKARFNTDSAVTDKDGKYLLPETVVKVPEKEGEVVASFHIYADGYDEGLIDPLAMLTPKMTVDFVLTGGVSKIKNNSHHSAFSPTLLTNTNNTITLNGIYGSAQATIYTANGTKISEHIVTSNNNSINLGNLFSKQLLLVEILSNTKKSMHKLIVK